jgi:phenylacetate-coenzyme A ligase PaaK-like adenylate-forming protein
VDRRLCLSTFHLSKETAPAFLDMLERRRPDYLMGCPSALEILGRFCLESGRTRAWRSRAVWFSGETVFEHRRDAVVRTFGAPSVGLFGSARVMPLIRFESDDATELPDATCGCVRDTEIPLTGSGKTKFVARTDRRS